MDNYYTEHAREAFRRASAERTGDDAGRQRTSTHRSFGERQFGSSHAQARLFVWPFEIMLRLQANVVCTIRESTESWMERRQQAADDAVQALESFMHCNDMGELFAIQQLWLERTIQRASEDIDALAEQGAALSREAASSTKEAGTRTFYSARAAAQQVEGSSHSEGAPETDSDSEREQNSNHRQSRRRLRERQGA